MPRFLDMHSGVHGLTPEAAVAAHQEAHGELPDDIFEVQELNSFLTTSADD